MDKILIASRILFAFCLTVFGIQNFMYVNYVARMVPGWIPFHLFWVYMVGIGLIAAAVGIAINKWARLACITLGAMIFLLVAIIQMPDVVRHIHNGGVIDNALDEVGLGCCAFILGSTFPKRG